MSYWQKGSKCLIDECAVRLREVISIFLLNYKYIIALSFNDLVEMIIPRIILCIKEEAINKTTNIYCSIKYFSKQAHIKCMPCLYLTFISRSVFLFQPCFIVVMNSLWYFGQVSAGPSRPGPADNALVLHVLNRPFLRSTGIRVHSTRVYTRAFIRLVLV